MEYGRNKYRSFKNKILFEKCCLDFNDNKFNNGNTVYKERKS